MRRRYAADFALLGYGLDPRSRKPVWTPRGTRAQDWQSKGRFLLAAGLRCARSGPSVPGPLAMVKLDELNEAERMRPHNFSSGLGSTAKPS